MAGDMLAVMRRLGHERFFLAGHDRGGRVAYRLALDHPERVIAFAAIVWFWAVGLLATRRHIVSTPPFLSLYTVDAEQTPLTGFLSLSLSSLVFIALLALGFIYDWRKGVFRRR